MYSLPKCSEPLSLQSQIVRLLLSLEFFCSIVSKMEGGLYPRSAVGGLKVPFMKYPGEMLLC